MKINEFSIIESKNFIDADSIKLFFDNNYLKWDTSTSDEINEVEFETRGDTLIIKKYDKNSQSILDLSSFNILMDNSIPGIIELVDSILTLNCVFMDDFNEFTIIDSVTLYFDPVISEIIPIAGDSWDELTFAVTLNKKFSDDDLSIKHPVLFFVIDSDTFIHDLDISINQTSVDSIYSAEFMLPDTLLDVLTSIQENTNVDVFLSLSNLEADDLRRSNSESSGFKLTPISFGWGDGINNIQINDSSRYLNPDVNNILFMLDSIISANCEIRIQNLITNSIYNLGSFYIDGIEIEISGDDIRGSLGNNIDGLYDIIIQKIGGNGYSFPFIKQIIIDTQAPQYKTIIPTTDIYNDIWDSRSIHSVTDEDEIIFTYLNYPYQIADDSIIFITDKMRTPFNLSGFQFNDSLTVDVVITVIDSLGSTSEISLNSQAVDGMYEFQKLLQIELGDSMIYPFIQGQDSLIIQYTSTDMAGNVSVHKVKYNLYTEDDFSGLVNRIFNYPNPFSSLEDGTKIRYVLTDDGLEGKYIVFDAKGELVYHYELSSDELMKGTHTINWSGKYLNDKYVLATGIYFGFLDIDDTIAKHKLVIMN